MANDEMQDKTKEFYVKKVEKYNENMPRAKRRIALGSAILAVVGIYVLMNILGMVSEQSMVRYAAHVGMASSSLGGLCVLISGVADKAGIKASIDEIKEFFRQYGLVLEDEISKGRGK